MWIKITKPFYILGGDIRLDFIYVKAYSELLFDNTNINTYLRCYSSRESFYRDINSNIKIDGYDQIFHSNFKRTSSDVDLIKHIYTDVIKQLTTAIINKVPKTDEQGNIIYDEQGNIIYVDIIIKPALCELKEVELIEFDTEK